MNPESTVAGLLAAFFLLASSIKIVGWHKAVFELQLAMIIKYGLNREIMALIGLVELFGAIAILFQGSWVGLLGGLALFGTSVGALFFHLLFDSWRQGIPAMITAALSAFIVWNHSKPLLDIS